jgi:hypothetical protein
MATDGRRAASRVAPTTVGHGTAPQDPEHDPFGRMVFFTNAPATEIGTGPFVAECSRCDGTARMELPALVRATCRSGRSSPCCATGT